jgi:hypothetical protein
VQKKSKGQSQNVKTSKRSVAREAKTNKKEEGSKAFFRPTFRENTKTIFYDTDRFFINK